MRSSSSTILGLLMLTIVAACGGKEPSDRPNDDDRAKTPPAASAGPTVAPTGKTIVVELYTDEKGNYFNPARFTARRGDMIRFTLMSGVHNVNFLADSNPGMANLPPMSEFLQIPGQTYDLLVSVAAGKYYFQCDPHALLGMIGFLDVEDDT